MSDLSSTQSKSSSPQEFEAPNIVSAPIFSAVLIFASFVSIVVVWSITYRMPITSQGKGLIHTNPRLFSVKARSNGFVDKLNVSVGDSVRADQNLAELFIGNKLADSDAARKEGLLAETNLSQTNTKVPYQLQQQILSLTELLNTTKTSIQKQEAILKTQEKNLQTYQSLAQKGYLSEVELLEYTEKAVSFQKMVGKSRGDYNKLLAQKVDIERKLSQAIRTANRELIQAERNRTTTTNNLMNARNLKSPVDGRIIQISQGVGDTVSEGQELFVISPLEGKLTGTFLIDSSEIGKVNIGDSVLISPSSTSSARFGYINGKVTSFSSFPTDEGSFASFIGSSLVSKMIFKKKLDKSPIILQVTLDYDDSKLTWTGSDGPPWQIETGELATIKVIYERRLPISYVAPFFRNLTGVSEFD